MNGVGACKIPAKHNPFASANVIGAAEITVGAETGDSIVVGVQLQNANKVNLAQVGHVRCYISDDADGSSLAGTAPDTVAISADGVILLEDVSNKVFTVISNDTGYFDIAIGENGADTWYLVLMMPDGSVVVSEAITFAA